MGQTAAGEPVFKEVSFVYLQRGPINNMSGPWTELGCPAHAGAAPAGQPALKHSPTLAISGDPLRTCVPQTLLEDEAVLRQREEGERGAPAWPQAQLLAGRPGPGQWFSRRSRAQVWIFLIVCDLPSTLGWVLMAKCFASKLPERIIPERQTFGGRC